MILSQATDYEAQIEAIDRRYQEALEAIEQTDDDAKRKSLTDEMIKLTLEKESLEAHLGPARKQDEEPSETALVRSEAAEGPGLDRLIWWSPVIAVVIVFAIASLIGRVIGLSPFVFALPAAIIAGIVTMVIRGRLQA